MKNVTWEGRNIQIIIFLLFSLGNNKFYNEVPNFNFSSILLILSQKKNLKNRGK